jgi:mannose-1-phosphate guanylyltransferase/mannose-6-phosphate isomerase
MEAPAPEVSRVNTYVRGITDNRPWGKWETLETGPGFTVKRIDVAAGHKLSLQRHRHRAEHWIVAMGTALVTRDGETFHAPEHSSVWLPCGCVHRMENPGPGPLVMIEVQVGVILDEGDIERIEDTYGRVTS